MDLHKNVCMYVSTVYMVTLAYSMIIIMMIIIIIVIIIIMVDIYIAQIAEACKSKRVEKEEIT